MKEKKYLKIFGAIHLSLPKLLCMKLPHYIDMTFRYFYTLPYSKDIYFLDGKIDNYFHQNIFTNLKEHCDAMNQYTMEYSSLLLEESLNTLSSNCKIVNLSSFDFDSDVFINKAVKIANIILQNVITSNKNNAVLWPELITHGSVLSIDYPDN